MINQPQQLTTQFDQILETTEVFPELDRHVKPPDDQRCHENEEQSFVAQHDEHRNHHRHREGTQLIHRFGIQFSLCLAAPARHCERFCALELRHDRSQSPTLAQGKHQASGRNQNQDSQGEHLQS